MIVTGAHFPVGESLHATLEWLNRYKCFAMQVFLHSPYQYFIPKGFVWSRQEEFKKVVEEKNITVIVHSCFLINLGSPKPNIYGVSKKSLVEDAKMAASIGAKYLVFHTGSHTKESTMEAGLVSIASGIESVLRNVPEIILLMENTAGRGTACGRDIKNLVAIINKVKPEYRERVGICLDTAHAWAGGYDVSNEFPETWGYSEIKDYVKVVHFNMPDPEVKLDSGLDRHKVSMDAGAFSVDGMKFLLHLFKDKILIMERPFDREENEMDTKVLDKDFALIQEWIKGEDDGPISGTKTTEPEPVNSGSGEVMFG